MVTGPNESWFRITSPVSGVDFVLVSWDRLGWKLDVHGCEHDEWPNGDTLQDTLDELIPFLAIYIDGESIWTDGETGQILSMFEALTRVTGRLDFDL